MGPALDHVPGGDPQPVGPGEGAGRVRGALAVARHVDHRVAGADQRVDLLLDDHLDPADVREPVMAHENDPHRTAFAGSDRYQPHVTTKGLTT